MDEPPINPYVFAKLRDEICTRFYIINVHYDGSNEYEFYTVLGELNNYALQLSDECAKARSEMTRRMEAPDD